MVQKEVSRHSGSDAARTAHVDSSAGSTASTASAASYGGAVVDHRQSNVSIASAARRSVQQWWIDPLALAIVSVVVGWLHDGWYDNDQWFILSNGRWILENGFPYENPFSAWGGKIVLDNWLWSIPLYLSYKVAGQAGIAALCTIVTTGSVLLAWSIARRLWAGRAAAFVVAMIWLLCQTFSMGMTDRPFVASALMILLNLRLVLEWTLRGWRWRGIWLLPVVTLAAFNLHMADGWFTVLFPGCWTLAAVILDRERRLWTLATAAGVSCLQALVTLANPWGVDGALFVFRGMGSASYREAIKDTIGLPGIVRRILDGSIFSDVDSLAAMIPPLAITVAMIITLAIASILGVVRSGSMQCKAVWTGLLIALAGSTALVSIAMRFTNDALLLTPFLAGVVTIHKRDGRLWKALSGKDTMVAVSALLILASCSTLGATPMNAAAEYDRTETAGVAARAVAERVPAGSEIMSDGWIGSKLTWMGYKTSFDMRPELIDSAVSGLPVDHYKEWIDATSGIDLADKFISKHKSEFEWWVIRDYDAASDTPMETAMSKRIDYKLVSAEPGRYALYKRR